MHQASHRVWPLPTTMFAPERLRIRTVAPSIEARDHRKPMGVMTRPNSECGQTANFARPQRSAYGDHAEIEMLAFVEAEHRPLGAWTGAGVGAVLGILFPPALLATAAVGAATGGVIGHLARGMSRSDMKGVGDLLDEGRAALIVVGESKIGEQRDKDLERAQKSVEADRCRQQRLREGARAGREAAREAARSELGLGVVRRGYRKAMPRSSAAASVALIRGIGGL
jgi:Protein of unknown function (DUF1269)